MKRTLTGMVVLFAGLCVAAVALSGCGGGSTNNTPPTLQSVDPVLQWNRILLGIVRAPAVPGDQPATVHPTHSFAIMHAAIYDAVNAVDQSHFTYLVDLPSPKASAPAAAAAAAHDTLVALYPSQKQMLDATLVQSLAQIPDTPGKNQGISVGQEVAKLILALRTNDGSGATPPPYTPGTQPGDYQLTPPKFTQPVFTHWSLVKPFALTSANQFRPGPRPDLTSAEYMAAYQETMSLGAKDSATRTADQTQIARFWSGKIQNYWNEIAQTAAVAHNNTLAQNARLFALLNLTLADDAIAFYDAKYTYAFWRPVTAIRAGDTDNNPNTIGDPNWTPLADTPLDPSYPGAHSVISTSAATVLASFFGSDNFSYAVTSEVLPGVQRSFTSFSGAAEEAGLSRIYIGHHFRTDHNAGQELGRNVGAYVVQSFLTPTRSALGSQ
ncbi:MAG: phosphatase family protein [Chthonomonadaceae bacterium]|nr:phosphatase family protein [Chthonomonadaceae bacterium]